MRELPLLPIFLLCLGPCLGGIIYLYLFPFFLECNFPEPSTFYHHVESGSEHRRLDNVTAFHPEPAPFRLLVLADPQLEGNTALPPGPKFPTLSQMRDEHERRRLSLSRFGYLVSRFFRHDVRRQLYSLRKRLDLVGNDYYLGHVYRTLAWWSRPTHVTVLGDLLGSQWISDQEFESRADRYWNRVFRGARRVEDDRLSTFPALSPDNQDRLGRKFEEEVSEELGMDKGWASRLLHVAGNHDIGYAGDIDPHRVARFEKRFGLTNGAISFTAPDRYLENIGLERKGNQSQPTLRIVLLNSNILDVPARSKPVQDEAYRFLNAVIETSKPHDSPSDAVVLLTHIPLHKPAGVCADGPLFTYFPQYQGGGIKEQNHLSEFVSQQSILQGLFGMRLDPPGQDGATPPAGAAHRCWAPAGRPGIILNGHDHVGCDVLHFLRPSSPDPASGDGSSEGDGGGGDGDGERRPVWDVAPTHPQGLQPGGRRSDLSAALPLPLRPPAGAADAFAPRPIREITARSMMGDFDGSAVLLSGWVEPAAGAGCGGGAGAGAGAGAGPELLGWRFESRSCSVGKHHLWWVAHVLVLVQLGLGLAAVLQKVLHVAQPGRAFPHHKKGVVRV